MMLVLMEFQHHFLQEVVMVMMQAKLAVLIDVYVSEKRVKILSAA